MNIGTVNEIHWYPIKSLAGIALESAKLTHRGLEGDRQYGLYNSEGKIASGKTTRRFFRVNDLLSIKTIQDSGSIFVELSSGKRLPILSTELNDYLRKPCISL